MRVDLRGGLCPSLSLDRLLHPSSSFLVPRSFPQTSNAHSESEFSSKPIISAAPSKSQFMSDKGRPLPKFGEWDVNDPASAEGFTVIFNKARDEKKTGRKPESPSKTDQTVKRRAELSKPPTTKWLCCFQPRAEP